MLVELIGSPIFENQERDFFFTLISTKWKLLYKKNAMRYEPKLCIEIFV